MALASSSTLEWAAGPSEAAGLGFARAVVVGTTTGFLTALGAEEHPLKAKAQDTTHLTAQPREPEATSAARGGPYLDRMRVHCAPTHPAHWRQGSSPAVTARRERPES